MKNKRYLPSDNPPMAFHRFLMFFSIPASIIVRVIMTVLEYNPSYGNIWHDVYLFDIIPIAATSIVLIIAGILLRNGHRTGIRLLIAQNIFWMILTPMHMVLFSFLGSPADARKPLSDNIMLPIYTLIIWRYYRKRLAFFYDTQICLSCGQKVRDIEPICPHCGKRWNDPDIETSVPHAEPGIIAAPQAPLSTEPPPAKKPRSSTWLVASVILVPIVAVALVGTYMGRRSATSSQSIPAEPTATGRASLDHADGYAPLKFGDTGDEVEALQRALASMGYMDQHQINGLYDQGTRKAVWAFQSDFLPDEPGYATSKTLAHLFDGPGQALPPARQTESTPTPQPSNTGTKYIVSPDILMQHKSDACEERENAPPP